MDATPSRVAFDGPWKPYGLLGVLDVCGIFLLLLRHPLLTLRTLTASLKGVYHYTRVAQRILGSLYNVVLPPLNFCRLQNKKKNIKGGTLNTEMFNIKFVQSC